MIKKINTIQLMIQSYSNTKDRTIKTAKEIIPKKQAAHWIILQRFQNQKED